MLRIGLTGGIACGKTRVRERLSAAGLPTLDLDHVGHAVMAPGGSAYAEVVAAFGPEILGEDGVIDRKALGAIVFADEAARRRLNAIVHPRVRQEEERRAAVAASAAGSVVVSDAALLVEAGMHLRFDRLVVVHCPPAEQLRRLMRRDGLDEAAARARIEAQMPVDEKRRFAHLAVDTSGSLAETDTSADRLAAELKALASAPLETVAVPAARALGGLAATGGHRVRGIAPLALAESIVAAGGLEMPAVASLLDPRPKGPWYRAARPGGGGEAAALALPVVLWALGRRADEPFLLAALYSLGCLVDQQPASLAGTLLFGLAAAAVTRTGGLPTDLEGTLHRWADASRRWVAGPPAPAVLEAVRAVHAHPQDLLAARAAGERAGGDPVLASILAGLTAGTPPDEAPLALRKALADLESLRADQ